MAKNRTERARRLGFVFTISLSCIILTSYGIAEDQKKEKGKPGTYQINIKTNYVARLNDISRPAGYDPNDNAADYYKKAFELCVDQPEQLRKSGAKGWPRDLPNDKRVMLEKWVSANGRALEQLKLGAAKPYYWRECQGKFTWDITMPQLSQAKTLAMAIGSRAKLSAEKANLKEALSDLLACYRFGMHLTGPKTLIEQLVGIAIRAAAVAHANQVIARTQSQPDLLKDFQEQLEKIASQKKPTLDLTFEKFGAYDLIQVIFTDDGKGGGRVPPGFGQQTQGMSEHFKMILSGIPEEQRSKWEKMERRQTTELADKLYEYFDSAAGKTPWQLHKQGKDLNKVVQEMTKDNPLVSMCTPARGRVLELSARSEAAFDALVTTVAILRYKAEKRRLPEKLDKLVSAGYLKNLPMDPYSDRALVYKTVDNDFKLYSLGADFDDDGGISSKWGQGKEGGDQVFWPPQQ